MRTSPPPDADVCASCVAQSGLCDRHLAHVVPQLAVNLGWLRLIGDAVVEQKRRQHIPAPDDATAIAKAQRRTARRQHRAGLRGLLVHVQTAA
jgi:hypothetical protein